MKGFKGFDKDMKCRGFQYSVGESYETDKADLCESGFHFCENPLDVLDYYDLIDNNGDMNRFGEIEAEEPVISDDKKSVTKKIRINAELGLKGLIDASIKFLFFDKTEKASRDYSQLAASGDNSKLAASRDYSKLAASGYGSKLAASGDNSQLAASGYGSKLAASGYGSKLAASGDNSQLAASRDYSKLAASGDYSKLAASGNGSKLAVSGDNSKLAASGDYSKLVALGNCSKLAVSGAHSLLAASGDNSVAANIGINGRIKGVVGTWITLAEYDEEGKCKCVKSAKIDGKRLKADTWYSLVNGKFTEI